MDPESAEMEGFQAFDDLHVVDCLLPGEVRRMGKTTFLSPRRPVRTTAADCRIRGGEYTAYDRADYRTALQVWMEKARSGDPEAQHYVGEIHEKGMGRAPDYAEAFEWYRRAAEQGYARSQVSLGYFYEQGLGTEPDVAESLKWYRRAAGAGEDELIFASAADERMRELRAELESELEQAQAERRALRQQIERLRAELESERGAGEAARQTVETLEGMLSRVESRAAEAEGRLIRMRGKLEPGIAARPAEPSATTQRMEAGQLNEFRFGKYYALVVGQEGYMFWDPLRSPHHDARRLAEILSLQYGFDTTLLLDASGSEILSSINDLRERVGSGDNVLIYFAGHGQLLRAQTGEQRRGYWLPVNAELERTTYWVSNSAINDYLAILDARSVLVIADSCFGGAMSTDPSSLLLGGAGVLNNRLVELGLSRKARYVLSSGGLRPVLDGSDAVHSVFARALIEALEHADGVFRAQDLLSSVADRTRRLALAVGVEQTPDLRPIREAGHEAGSFFFLPVRAAGAEP